MDLRIEKGNAFSILTLSGRLDALAAPQVRRVLRELPSLTRPFVVVHLQKVDFIDSTGLGALVAGLKTAHQHHGTVLLAHPLAQVRMALRLSQLDRIFPLYATLEEALEALTVHLTSATSVAGGH